MTQLALLLLCQCQQACHHPADVASANTQSGLPFGAVLTCAHQGIALGISGPVGPDLPRLALWGPWGNEFATDDRRVALCQLAPVGPWKACCLRLKKTCLRQRLTSNKHLLSLVGTKISFLYRTLEELPWDNQAILRDTKSCSSLDSKSTEMSQKMKVFLDTQ